MENNIGGSQTLVYPEDAGKSGEGVARRWMLEISLASKIEKDWRKSAKEVIDRYRGEGSNEKQRNRFNILYSNTQIIRSAVYSSTPIPDVRRRYRDDDPLGKQVADVLQRAGSLAIDSYDFNSVMNRAVMDSLLAGRAVSRVRWEPQLGQEEYAREDVASTGTNDQMEPMYPEGTKFDNDGPYVDGEAFEPKIYEEVTCEPVNWDDFLCGPGRTWMEVPWVAFRLKMTRGELREKFGEIGKKVILVEEGHDSDSKDDSRQDMDTFKKGVVWEIWDKELRKVIFVAPSFKDGPLLEEDDPLGLKEFFPCPEPMYSINRTDSMIPVTEFSMYQDQADELDLISHRIMRLISAMKARGVYDSSIGEFDQLFEEDDNAMIPSDNGGLALQAGGMGRGVWMLPIDTLSVVLAQLYQGREQIKNVIFEITGISDIIRGATRASETATAQNIKAKFGGMRLDQRQRDIARYARDLIRLKVEIIAEKFSSETLSLMTNRNVSEKMIELMRQDSLRTFRIDIETDSTIAGTMEQDMGEMQNLLTGIVNFMAGAGAMVASGQLPLEAAKKMLLATVRRSRLGREVEDAIQSIGEDEGGQPQQPQEEPPDPAAQAAQAQAQVAQVQAQTQAKESDARIQIEQQKLQLQQQKAAADASESQRKASVDEAKIQAEIAFKDRKLQAEINMEERKMEMERDLRREEMGLKYESELNKTTMNAGVKMMGNSKNDR